MHYWLSLSWQPGRDPPQLWCRSSSLSEERFRYQRTISRSPTSPRQWFPAPPTEAVGFGECQLQHLLCFHPSLNHRTSQHHWQACRSTLFRNVCQRLGWKCRDRNLWISAKYMCFAFVHSGAQRDSQLASLQCADSMTVSAGVRPQSEYGLHKCVNSREDMRRRLHRQ